MPSNSSNQSNKSNKSNKSGTTNENIVEIEQPQIVQYQGYKITESISTTLQGIYIKYLHFYLHFYSHLYLPPFECK